MKTTKITVELLSGTTLAIHPDNYYRHPLLYNVVQSGYVIGGLKHSVSRTGLNSYGLYGVTKGEVVLKTKNKTYNTLKASLFGKAFVPLLESDTSALGACITAMTAQGTFKSTGEAAASLCRYGEAEKPREILGLKKRFELFLKLYETNKENFIDFGRLV